MLTECISIFLGVDKNFFISFFKYVTSSLVIIDMMIIPQR